MIVFTILVTFAQIAAAACFVHLYRFPGRAFTDVIPYLRPNHKSELEDLLDPLREENLASALEHERFRKEQLKRIHLAQECIAQRTHNARIFQEWGYSELERSETLLAPENSDNASWLVKACLTYRLNACLMQAHLYAAYLAMVLLPWMRIPRLSRLCKEDSFDLLDSYDAVEQAAGMLASRCGDESREKLVHALRAAQSEAGPRWIASPERA